MATFLRKISMRPYIGILAGVSLIFSCVSLGGSNSGKKNSTKNQPSQKTAKSRSQNSTQSPQSQHQQAADNAQRLRLKDESSGNNTFCIDKTFGSQGEIEFQGRFPDRPPYQNVTISSTGDIFLTGMPNGGYAAKSEPNRGVFTAVKMSKDGVIDANFSAAGTKAYVRSGDEGIGPNFVSVTPDGKILTGGVFGYFVAFPAVSRYLTNGSIDLEFAKGSQQLETNKGYGVVPSQGSGPTIALASISGGDYGIWPSMFAMPNGDFFVAGMQFNLDKNLKISDDERNQPIVRMFLSNGTINKLFGKDGTTLLPSDYFPRFVSSADGLRPVILSAYSGSKIENNFGKISVNRLLINGKLDPQWSTTEFSPTTLEKNLIKAIEAFTGEKNFDVKIKDDDRFLSLSMDPGPNDSLYVFGKLSGFYIVVKIGANGRLQKDWGFGGISAWFPNSEILPTLTLTSRGEVVVFAESIQPKTGDHDLTLFLVSSNGKKVTQHSMANVSKFLKSAPALTLRQVLRQGPDKLIAAFYSAGKKGVLLRLNTDGECK